MAPSGTVATILRHRSAIALAGALVAMSSYLSYLVAEKEQGAIEVVTSDALQNFEKLLENTINSRVEALELAPLLGWHRLQPGPNCGGQRP